MADRRITQLVEVTSPNTNDVLAVVNNNQTKKVKVDNLVKASKFGTHSINELNPNNSPAPTLQLAAQDSDSNVEPIKITLQNIYPVPVDSTTVDLVFNTSNRILSADLIQRSLQPKHFSTGCVEGSAIALGTITEANLNPDAKLAGAAGGGTDRIFYENDIVMTASYTITNGKNAMTAGPLTISDGVSATVPDGSTWTIV